MPNPESPLTGQSSPVGVAPPEGYQLDVKPPEGYVLDSLKPPAAVYDQGPNAGQAVSGALEPGNIDVNHRPVIWNPSGPSTIYSTTVPLDKDGSVWKGEYHKAPKYALVPTISDGKFLVPGNFGDSSKGENPNTYYGMDGKPAPLEDAAAEHYSRTKEHLGVFSTPADADKYAEQTHAWMPTGGPEKVYHPSYQGKSNMPLMKKEYEAELQKRQKTK